MYYLLVGSSTSIFLMMFRSALIALLMATWEGLKLWPGGQDKNPHTTDQINMLILSSRYIFTIICHRSICLFVCLFVCLFHFVPHLFALGWTARLKLYVVIKNHPGKVLSPTLLLLLLKKKKKKNCICFLGWRK